MKSVIYEMKNTSILKIRRQIIILIYKIHNQQEQSQHDFTISMAKHQGFKMNIKIAVLLLISLILSSAQTQFGVEIKKKPKGRSLEESPEGISKENRNMMDDMKDLQKGEKQLVQITNVPSLRLKYLLRFIIFCHLPLIIPDSIIIILLCQITLFICN